MQSALSVRAGRRRRLFVAPSGEGQSLIILAEGSGGKPIKGTLEYSRKGGLGIAAKVAHMPLKRRTQIKLDSDARDIAVSVIPDQDAKIVVQTVHRPWMRSLVSACMGASVALAVTAMVLVVLSSDLV